jgi:hypothetical protein
VHVCSSYAEYLIFYYQGLGLFCNFQLDMVFFYEVVLLWALLNRLF